jgi:glucokinase
MALLQTITPEDMRRINRSCVLEIIRLQGPISRTAISQQLDVSLPTVMRIVDDLFDEDLVQRDADTQWSGGRRRSLLSFNSEGHIVLGVDLGGTKMFGALSTLGGEVVDEVHFPQHGTSGDESFDQLLQMVETLLASPRLAGRPVRGIGVGAPGVTRHEEGIVTWAPSLQWRDYPLRHKLEEQIGIPVSVDNDVNLAVLGELWFGAGRNVRNMVLITVGTGIGSGIVINGVLYRGSREASGEIGYFLPGREFLGRRYAQFGALEEIASGNGIADRGRRELRAARTPEELTALTAEDVFKAARDGEAWALKVIDETVDYLAMTVGNVQALLDPELIVLGGGVARSADLLIEPILRRLEGALPMPPRLVPSSLGRRAAVMGAIVNVLHNTDDFFVVQKLS